MASLLATRGSSQRLGATPDLFNRDRPHPGCLVRAIMARCMPQMAPHMNLDPGPLLTDLYQLNMIQAYLDHDQTEPAVFEFFVRSLPKRRRFLMAAGLEQALEFLETLKFSAGEIDWLPPRGGVRQRPLPPS